MTDLAGQIRAGMTTLIATRTATMLDTGVVKRPPAASQTPTLDADGNVVPAFAPTVYDGPCILADPKMPPRRGGISPQEMSGSPEQRQLRVPHTADLHTGDVFTLTASAFSPGLVGDEFVVVREDERSYASDRAYILRGSAWQS